MTSSPAAWRAFESVFLPFLRRRLHVVQRGGINAPPDLPVILAANHTSWWDGFLLRALQRTQLPAAALHTVMLEDELRRHPYLRLLGALPLQPGRLGSTRGMLRTLRNLRARPRQLVLSYFPQGKIVPSWQRPLAFQRGVERVAKVLDPCIIVPVALHIEPLTRAAPVAFVSVGAAVEARVAEAAVTAELDGVFAWIREHGEAAAAGFGTARDVPDRAEQPVVRAPAEATP